MTQNEAKIGIFGFSRKRQKLKKLIKS